MAVPREAILSALSKVTEPDTGRSILDLGMVSDVAVDPQSAKASISLKIRNPNYPQKEKVARAIEQALGEIEGLGDVALTWNVDVASRPVGEDDPVPGVSHVVLVMSGKGGVGKSTVSTNIALALARMGLRVGLLDADIYGPSIPTMLGITGQPLSDGKKITPLARFGVKLMSIGFLLEDAKSAVVWRGPMLHGALLQFLKDVEWGDLDYLLLDLPPGTGDVALTLSQRVRTSGALIVTTPQEVALQDVYKSVSMAKKVDIPVLGVVENESYFTCDACDKRHELFGSGGGQKVADFAEAPLLGQIPLDPQIREWGDAGTPVVQASPGSEVAKTIVAIAEKLVEAVAERHEAPGGVPIDRSGGANRRLPVAR